ncbi:PP2C family protein-serine/threonine phosphatase [Streptomyces sp. NPDC052236]|uniref:PP2C family protein-serine/threonine phosphatase n=1 Tax=Streptomyces sp. NPDC052236 TaxID=3365686 RepID=UPI0037D24D9E
MAEEGPAELARLLAMAEAGSPVESADVVARELAKRLGAYTVSLLVVDYTGNAVVRLSTTKAGEARESIDLPDSVYEQVLRTQQVGVRRAEHARGHVQVLAPVTNRGDAIGLLELFLPAEPGPAVLQRITEAAHALAYVLIANRRFTDLYRWGRRTLPMSLAAEIQHQLLPDALTCEADQFTVAGQLVPAEQIGGDTFDYSLDRHTLHLSITDAMGHHVGAALLATLLVGALRNGRRSGADLAEQAHQAHQAVSDHSGGAMVTGQLLRIDLPTGHAGLVNAGHPWPWRLRRGTLEHLTLEIDLPFGAPMPRHHRVQSLQLEPGDRLILVTDGMLDRNAAEADLPALMEHTAGLHPRETVHALTQAVLRAEQGFLRDDAAVVCFDWRGPQRGRYR